MQRLQAVKTFACLVYLRCSFVSEQINRSSESNGEQPSTNWECNIWCVSNPRNSLIIFCTEEPRWGTLGKSAWQLTHTVYLGWIFWNTAPTIQTNVQVNQWSLAKTIKLVKWWGCRRDPPVWAERYHLSDDWLSVVWMFNCANTEHVRMYLPPSCPV